MPPCFSTERYRVFDSSGKEGVIVNNEHITGGTETCILIDGTVRRTPVAEIETETPYYAGKVKAVRMENPLYDLIIGNVPSMSNEINDPVEAQVVATTAQAKQQPSQVSH